MSELLEDEVAAFVRDRRPLKLIFIAVALIGIVGSAISALKPLYEGFQPFVYRAVGVNLNRTERQRYGCAYELGQSASNMTTTVRIASSLSPKVVDATFSRYRDVLTLCQATLGSPYHAIPMLYTKDTAAAFFDSLYETQGALRSKDRLSSLFFDLGQLLSTSKSEIEPQSPEDRKLVKALEQADKDRLKGLKEAYDEASSLCPCKLPVLDVGNVDRNETVARLNRFDEGMELLLQHESLKR